MQEQDVMGGGLSKGETGPVMDEAYLRQLIEALGGPEALRKGAKEFRHCSAETSSTTGMSSMIRRTVYSNAWSATPTTTWKFPDPVQSDAHTHLLLDPANSRPLPTR